MCPQEKFGGYWVTEWDFRGVPKQLFFEHFLDFRAISGPHKISLNDPITPKFLLWAHFDPNSTIFHFERILISYKTKK